MDKYKIAPSIMCADPLRLAEEIKELEKCRINMFHCDVMDGQYVDNIGMGFYIIRAVKKFSKIPIDVHLAVMEPEKYIDILSDIGADFLSVHVERVKCLNRVIKRIKDSGMKVSVALNPSTPVCMIENIIKYVDMILVMTVDPGFEGQTFVPETIEKIKKIKSIARNINPNLLIQVDGNINKNTIPYAVNAGADVLVLGTSALFNKNGKGYGEKIEEVLSLIKDKI